MEITADAGATFTSRDLTFTAGTDVLTITTTGLTGSNAGAHFEDIRSQLASESDLKGFSFTFVDSNGDVLASTAGENWRDTASAVGAAAAGTIAKMFVSRDDNVDFELAADGATELNVSIDGGSNFTDLATTANTTTVLEKSAARLG